MSRTKDRIIMQFLFVFEDQVMYNRVKLHFKQTYTADYIRWFSVLGSRFSRYARGGADGESIFAPTIDYGG